jgi:CRISPR-associated protein Csb2
MPSFLSISVRFLQDVFHGRRDAGEPEWPPSPNRLFQALVRTAAAHWNDVEFFDRAIPALQWLESQPPPDVVSPPTANGAPYRLSVPNNAMDLVARAWVRGNTSGEGDANPATHRAMKTVRPTRIVGSEPLTYLWQLPEHASDQVLGIVETLCIVARAVSALGWGIDLVAVHGCVVSQQEADALTGERWSPAASHRIAGYRVPRPGTLKELLERHNAFLHRISAAGFSPVPPVSAFNIIGYRRATDPPVTNFAAFSLLEADASRYRVFSTSRQTATVAGLLRHATKRGAKAAGWSDDKVAMFVLGHREADGEPHRPVGPHRFSYIPLPSIEARGQGRSPVVGGVRRALVAVIAGGHWEETEWASRALSGMELVDEDSREPVAVLSLLPRNEKMIQRYLRSSSTWSTVTPLVLPGHDDPSHYRRRLKRGVPADEQKRLLEHLEARVDRLIRKAIVQAGFSPELAQCAELDWRSGGFWSGCELATRYTVPDKLRRFPRLHVRIRWRDRHGDPLSIAGPVCLGGGRFAGLGLLAPE